MLHKFCILSLRNSVELAHPEVACHLGALVRLVSLSLAWLLPQPCSQYLAVPLSLLCFQATWLSCPGVQPSGRSPGPSLESPQRKTGQWGGEWSSGRCQVTPVPFPPVLAVLVRSSGSMREERGYSTQRTTGTGLSLLGSLELLEGGG